jgi:GNAT superfamily N-acetyltransferase
LSPAPRRRPIVGDAGALFRFQHDNGEVSIRAARRDDFPVLQDIERAAGRWFLDVGMPEIAADEPFSLDELAGWAAAGRAWVATDDEDVPVGYLVADLVGGDLHVEQVSVHPRASRLGIGRSLLDYAAGYAAARGLPALTLTTFTGVPWNAPYYARLGFRPLAGDELTPEMRAVVEREIGHGLHRWPRVYMRRAVTGRS